MMISWRQSIVLHKEWIVLTMEGLSPTLAMTADTWGFQLSL